MPSTRPNYFSKNKQYGFQVPEGDVSFIHRYKLNNIGPLGSLGNKLGFWGNTSSWKNDKITIPADVATDRSKFNEWWIKKYGGQNVPNEAWSSANEAVNRTQYNQGVTAANESFDQQDGPTFDEVMAMFGDQGGGDGGAAARQQAIDAITQSYDRQIGGLNTNKTNAANLIQQYANQFKTNLQPITQQFQGATQASVGEIARRAATGQSQASNLAKELSGSLAGLGVNAQPIQQQANINAQQASQASGYEQDFTNRLAQIAAMNEANALSGNELVRQGAAGTLEQNYSQMLTALQNAKEQEILSAQTSGGGGGGGGGSSSDPLDQMAKYFRTRQLFDEVMGGGTDYTDISSLMNASAKKDPTGFFTAIMGMTPEQRQAFGIGQ